MADPQDRVDIPGVMAPSAPSDVGRADRRRDADPDRAPRPWLGIYFHCCAVYGRIYRDAAARRYVGRCPGCGGEISCRIGPSGTNRRFFEAI